MLSCIIQRPIGVMMTTIAVIAISLVFIRSVPISLLPDIQIPHLSVHISAPDMDAQTLETTVTRVIKNQMMQVNHLKSIESHTRNGSAIIKMTMDFGTDTDLASIELNEKLDQIMQFLPREMDRPRVIKTNLSDIPVFYVDACPKEPAKSDALLFSSFVKRTLKKRLEQINEVAFVDVHGTVVPEILIIPDRDVLQSLNISETALSRAISNSNITLGNILLKDGVYQYSVTLTNRLTDIRSLKSIYLSINNQVYRLNDLAQVVLDQKPQRGSFLYNSTPGVSLAIRTKSDANNFVLRSTIDIVISDLRIQYPELAFELSNDQSSILEASINNLRTSLIYGLGIAGFVMFFFFRDWRLPLLIIISLPIGIVLTLFGFFLLDISINIISLSGLILGIGLMIDNAIIIVENVKQKSQQEDLKIAAVSGAEEVIKPLISSALTTSSVFLPMILLSGLAGVLFYDQALSIALALTSSLLVSYFLLPVLASIMLKNKTKRDDEKNSLNLHTSFISGVVQYRKVLIPIFLLLGLANYFPYQRLEKKAFPSLTRSAHSLDIDWGEPITLATNEERYHKIADILDKWTTKTTAYIGELQYFISSDLRQSNESQIEFTLSDPLDIQYVEEGINDFLASSYPQASHAISPIPNVFDRVFDTDPNELYAHIIPVGSLSLPPVDDVRPLFRELKQVKHDIAFPITDRYMGLTIHQERLARYQVDYNAVVDKLKFLFRSNEITQLQASEEYIPIQLAADQEPQDVSRVLQSISIQNTRGAQLPLSELVSTRLSQNYKEIRAIQSGECFTIPFRSYSKSLVDKLKSVVSQNGKYTVQFSGSYFEELALRKELLLVGGVVFLLLFLILAAQFESLIQPLIVALTLPVGVLGALLALYTFGATLNIVSIIGIIIMSGIDVNDAILKIDMINKGVQAGLPLESAIIHGSERRLRPIIMTSLTTILAMTPILFASGLGAEIQRPLAIAVIGGLIFGTIASIVMVPMLYRAFYRRAT